MALANFAGTQYQNCTIALYAGTGYDVYHLPLNQDQVNNRTPDYGNYNAKYLTHYGIGEIIVAMPPANAEFCDYCRITPDTVNVRGVEAAGPVLAYNPDKANLQLFGGDVQGANNYNTGNQNLASLANLPGYYFVTGCEGINGGLVRFTIMLDCYTTIGATPADFGGFFTRIPVNSFGVYNDDNFLAEPFTTSFRNVYNYSVIKPKDILPASSFEANLILSPYQLTHVVTNELTSFRTGTSSSSTTTVETGSTLTGDNSETISYATSEGADPTTFELYNASTSDDDKITQDYGVAAYYRTNVIQKVISNFYASGITNVVYDAYKCLISSATGGNATQNTAITKITGAFGTKQYTTPWEYTGNKKTVWYGRYVMLISLSTGEAQTVPLQECMEYNSATDNAIYINIDMATDPSPYGGIYARIRKNTEEIDPDDVGSGMNAAMLPGGVKSSTWKRITTRGMIGGRGVEAGQTWRSAELNIDAATAAQNAAATAAQYDLTAGHGYLLRNAGNEYGLETLTSKQKQAAAEHSAQLQSNQISQVANVAQSALGTVSSIASGFTATSDSGIIGGIASGASTAIGGVAQAGQLILQRDLENSNYTALLEQNAITRMQYQDQGAYQTQNLQAQAAAATQIANAGVEKNNLLRTRLAECPTIPFLSESKDGIIDGSDDRFVLLFVSMDSRDSERLNRTMWTFGQTVYISCDANKDNIQANIASGGASGANCITPNKGWNFVKVDPGADWPNVTIPATGTAATTANYPAWVYKGARDQISAGIWLYKPAGYAYSS